MDRRPSPDRQEGEFSAVQRHVSDGARRIERQRKNLEELRKDGLSTGQAQEVLEALETTQRLHEGDLARFRDSPEPQGSHRRAPEHQAHPSVGDPPH
jgi:hypothetical protein